MYIIYIATYTAYICLYKTSWFLLTWTIFARLALAQYIYICIYMCVLYFVYSYVYIDKYAYICMCEAA